MEVSFMITIITILALVFLCNPDRLRISYVVTRLTSHLLAAILLSLLSKVWGYQSMPLCLASLLPFVSSPSSLAQC